MGKILIFSPKCFISVASQFIWYNEHIKIDNNTIYKSYFSQNISALFESNCKMKSWEDLRAKLDLDDNKKFYWKQIIHAIPRAWKENCLECADNISDLIINKHHLIKKHQICCLEKLNSRELYKMQFILNVKKPTAQTYHILRKTFTNYDTIFYILTKCSTDLEKRYPRYALFAWKNLKAQLIFFILVQKQTFSRRSYNILSKMY